ncbi:protein kinase [Streptomyces kanasensis]|uniref:serine/threonine-protein kinase n=1 Tax=Streptomyces kanasensis TaxID=936756 RepID=UPI003700063D
MDPLTPDDPAAIGPFRLLGRLGTGGMGRVYLARSVGGRTVAVKVVHPELAAREEFRRRFTREVAALERVGGAGTAPVLGSDTAAEAPWVAIGYVAGPSLRAVVGDGYGPLPAASVRALAVGLAEALRHIHAAGLVHRDLKPANVLLTVDGPRVIDFGIARAVDTVTDGGLTGTGAIVGSPGFMSPEQVRGERVTPASDVFCLGSVLAYAATGRSPFGTADSGVHALMFRIAHDEPDLADLPPELDELVRACLAKDPADRPTAAAIARGVRGADPWLPAELLAQLGRLAARLLDADGDPAPDGGPTPADGPAPDDGPADVGRATDTGGPSPTGSTAPAEPGGAPRRRRSWAVAAAAAVALAVAGTALTVAYWPERGTPSGAGGGKAGGVTGDGTAGPGVVPAGYPGAWEGVVRGTPGAPYETIRVEIGQGRPGEKVGVYAHVTGDRLCMGRSTLVRADQGAVVLGESDITVSVPEGRCTPAAHQTLALRSAQVLEWRSGAVKVTLRRVRSGPEVVPAKLVGDWKRIPFTELPPGQEDLYGSEITLSQGPVGAPLVRMRDTHPVLDDETALPTSGTVTCYRTAVVGAVGDVVVLGPPQLDEEQSDKDCERWTDSQSLRITRVGGKEMLHTYSMAADGEPGEYVRD